MAEFLLERPYKFLMESDLTRGTFTVNPNKKKMLLAREAGTSTPIHTTFIFCYFWGLNIILTKMNVCHTFAGPTQEWQVLISLKILVMNWYCTFYSKGKSLSTRLRWTHVIFTFQAQKTKLVFIFMKKKVFWPIPGIEPTNFKQKNCQTCTETVPFRVVWQIRKYNIQL